MSMTLSETPERRKHIGVDSFFAERGKLLSDYDKAKKQTADDAMKTDHGNVAEGLTRRWLETFLPKRFGVCKGYIITTNLAFQGDLEEWDILIYDATESPTLFTRGGSGNGEERRAIPIEHVRAVVEVKATLTPENAVKCANKLLKIDEFIGTNQSAEYPQYLCPPFVCTAVFFETKVRTFSEYRSALDSLAKLYQNQIPFMGSLILRSERNNDHSGYVDIIASESPMLEEEIWERSSTFNLPSGLFGTIGTMGWGYNNYPTFLFDLLASIRGTRTGRASSFYGLDFENTRSTRLFH